uniref:CBS domain-containing protein n=1 Tax=Zea mays TaxID=4577 RepID=A0A804MIP4_MAIZE
PRAARACLLVPQAAGTGARGAEAEQRSPQQACPAHNRPANAPAADDGSRSGHLPRLAPASGVHAFRHEGRRGPLRPAAVRRDTCVSGGAARAGAGGPARQRAAWRGAGGVRRARWPDEEEPGPGSGEVDRRDVAPRAGGHAGAAALGGGRRLLRRAAVLRPAARGRRRRQMESTVAEVMTSPAITLTLYKTVLEAAALMLKEKVHRIPVVNEQQHVIGIVTRSDVFQALEATSKAWE